MVRVLSFKYQFPTPDVVLVNIAIRKLIESLAFKIVSAGNEVKAVVEVKVDPVAVALDLEPVDFAATPAEPAKKPRKPKAPKEKALAKKPAVIKAKASKKSA